MWRVALPISRFGDVQFTALPYLKFGHRQIKLILTSWVVVIVPCLLANRLFSSSLLPRLCGNPLHCADSCAHPPRLSWRCSEVWSRVNSWLIIDCQCLFNNCSGCSWLIAVFPFAKTFVTLQWCYLANMFQYFHSTLRKVQSLFSASSAWDPGPDYHSVLCTSLYTSPPTSTVLLILITFSVQIEFSTECRKGGNYWLQQVRVTRLLSGLELEPRPRTTVGTAKGTKPGDLRQAVTPTVYTPTVLWPGWNRTVVQFQGFFNFGPH